MVEDQVGTRKDYLRELAPWTKLFSAFKIALDPKKLLLAAGGVLVMALGWYVLSVIFFSIGGKKPERNDYALNDADAVKRAAAWLDFKRDRARWYLLYEMAGTLPPEAVREDAADLADYDPIVYERIDKDKTGKPKPYGRFRTLPWFEDRGPNPFLVVTGEHDLRSVSSDSVDVTKAAGGFLNWLVQDSLPVLLEPLYKFFQPVIYITKPEAGFWNRVYLFLLLLWSLATWAFFGGAITRIAAVQVARPNERVGLTEAAKFVIARYKAYLAAPIIPLLFLAVLAVVLLVFGFVEAWTGMFGDIVLTLLWPIALLIGLIMAVVLVGLVGWPLMYTTISAEGSDSFDAISRSYSYVYQAPWQYLWNAFVALVYGAAVVFFIGLMGSLTVYMTKWAVTLTPTPESREPSYLFQWAPTSFGWRNLLLHRSPHAKPADYIDTRGRNQQVMEVVFDDKDYSSSWNNKVGSFFIAVWLYLVFLLIVGFGYSYFWTASTIIYLLMRQKVDDTEMDEIHLEEEPEQPFLSPVPPPPMSTEPPKPNQQMPQRVESPQLRMPTPPAATPQPTPTPLPVPPPGSTPSAEPVKEPAPAPAPPGGSMPPSGAP